MSSWNLQQLRSFLNSNPKILGWIATQENLHRRERYFMLDRDAADAALIVDQDREVTSQEISIRIFVDIGKPGRQGEISKKLFKGVPLEPQMDSAIEAAGQTDHQAWALPVPPSQPLPQLRTADPRILEDIEGVMTELSSRIRDCVGKVRETRFNSAELFLSSHERELHLSNGVTHRSFQTRLYSEAAFSFARNNPRTGEREADEYLNTRWAVGMEDLQIERLFEETSDRARHSLDVEKPITGKYPVIVDAEVLATLFNGHVSQLSAANAYHRLPFVKPGEELIPQASGDLLSISLDPMLELGADTVAVSDQGVPQKPLQLVEGNRVVATAADQQHAVYLETAPTSVRGTIVVEAGSLTHEALTRQGSQVIEILQFSGLFADPNSGTFSSEIRLARLYDNRTGQTRYLKGGSLSGSIVENFKGARLSRERVKRAHFSSGAARGEGYFGPEFALLSDVSIVGG